MVPARFSSSRESSYRPCHSGIHPNISQLIFPYGPSTFQTAASVLGLGGSHLCISPLKVELGFLIVSGFLGVKPCWFSKIDIIGACFPSSGTQEWGP